ncbi:MAG: MobC family plasmid mobilization relaxosome protein [Lachnospiraceae bacterium]|nr:MobC family plasmid mobilization relaxosome protein [Lachnospiraceae bacterium]
MADTIHCIKKTLRLMPVEAKQLAEKSKEAGMCEADYLRLLITQKPNDYPEIRILLKDLINEVNAIGNNINQITRNHNSKIYREADRELLSAYMKKLNLLVREVSENIEKHS